MCFFVCPPAEALLHSLLSDGIDPAHLVLVGRRLNEVVRVGLSDDFKQVALDVAFYTCAEGRPRGF